MKLIAMKVSGVIIGLLMSQLAFAACEDNSCVGVKITRLFVHDSGVSIGTSGNESALNCNAGTKGYIKLSKDHGNYNSLYSLLLTSHTTQDLIWVRTSKDVDGNCTVSYLVSDK